MEQQGRCLCGAVTFSARNVDPHAHACHCGTCRRWSGGPGLSAAVGSISFDGAEHVERFDSSDWAERGFCRRCGSHLFYRVKATDQYHVWLGAFDQPEVFALAGEIYVDEKPPGYAFAGDHPRLTAAEFLASIGASGS